MTSEITGLAFEAGAELAYLTPGDEGAFRVYERAGYRDGRDDALLLGSVSRRVVARP